jgi:type 1 fimbriae regulatory protein FimB/type 1 fimbriae regulatory protein FimE|tara:strand:- start:78 stop:314 length:237 start_codon:yes stop_codon:yes gene_type:complete
MSKISYLREHQSTTPNIENRKVLPTPPKYNQVREREYLLPDEIERISKADKSVGRHVIETVPSSRLLTIMLKVIRVKS